MSVESLIIFLIASVIFLELYARSSKRFTQCESRACSLSAIDTLAMRMRNLCDLKALLRHFEERLLELDAEIGRMECAVAEDNIAEDLQEYALRRIANHQSEREEIHSNLSDLSHRLESAEELVSLSREAAEAEMRAARQHRDRMRVASACVCMD